MKLSVQEVIELVKEELLCYEDMEQYAELLKSELKNIDRIKINSYTTLQVFNKKCRMKHFGV